VISGVGDECLLDGLVGVGLLFCQTLDLRWDVGERWVVRVSEVIVVEQSCVTLLDELSVRTVSSFTASKHVSKELTSGGRRNQTC